MPLRARTALHTQIHGRQNAHALHRRCTRTAHAPRMHCTGPAQALHDLPLLRVRQHGVRLGNCFELGLRLLLHFRLVLIRVPLEAQLAEGLLDLALARGALDAKDLVVVSTCSRGSWALWSPVSSRTLSVRADDEQRDEQAQPPGTAHVSRSSLPRARRRPLGSNEAAGGISAASSRATASAACRISGCREPSSSGACSAASSSEGRRRECLYTCRTPTSSSTRRARGAWPTARKRARTPRACRKADAERGPHIDGSTAF